MFSWKTLPLRKTFQQQQSSYSTPEAGGVPRCLCITVNGIRIPKSVRSCAAARARAGADNTAPLRDNRLARAKNSVWLMFRPDAQPKPKPMHAALHRGSCTCRVLGTSLSYSMWWPVALSCNPDDHFSCDMYNIGLNCRRYVDTPPHWALTRRT